MSRIAWASLLRQTTRADSGWRPMVGAVALGFALTVLSFAIGHRGVQHMSEMAVVPAEPRIQIAAGTSGLAASAGEIDRDLARIRANPRVRSAAWLEGPVRSMWWRPEFFAHEGRRVVGWTIVAGAGAAETLGLKLVAGRIPVENELGGPIVPVVVARSFLAELGSGAWIGARVHSIERGVDVEVVGVVEDFLSHGRMQTSRNTVLWFTRPTPGPQPTYLVRVDEDQLEPALGELSSALSAPGRLVRVERMRDVLALTHGRAYRARAFLRTLVAGLVLTVLLGTVAVCAFRIVERRRQLGIMRAVGARRSDVAWLVVAESGAATVVGITFGIVLAGTLFYVLEPLIPFLEIQPWMVLVAISLFVLASVAASLFPALQASRVPPSIASRPD